MVLPVFRDKTAPDLSELDRAIRELDAQSGITQISQVVGLEARLIALEANQGTPSPSAPQFSGSNVPTITPGTTVAQDTYTAVAAAGTTGTITLRRWTWLLDGVPIAGYTNVIGAVVGGDPVGGSSYPSVDANGNRGLSVVEEVSNSGLANSRTSASKTLSAPAGTPTNTAYRASWKNQTPATSLAIITTLIADDVAVAHVISDGTTTTPISWPTGFNEVAGSPVLTTYDGQTHAVAVKADCTGSEGTITFDAAQSIVGAVYAFAGRDNTTPLSVAAVVLNNNIGDMTPWPISGSITPAHDGCEIVCLIADDIAGNTGPATSHAFSASGLSFPTTPHTLITDGTFHNGGGSSAKQVTAGGVTVSATGSNNGNHAAGVSMFLLALKPSGAGGGGSPPSTLLGSDSRWRYRPRVPMQTCATHDSAYPFNTVLAGNLAGTDVSMGDVLDPLVDSDAENRMARLTAADDATQKIMYGRIKRFVSPFHNGFPRYRGGQFAAVEINSYNQNIRFGVNYIIFWASRPHFLIPASPAGGYAFVGLGGFHTNAPTSGSSKDPFHIFLTRTGYVIGVSGESTPSAYWGTANDSEGPGFFRDSTGDVTNMHYFVMFYRAHPTNGHVEIYRRIGRAGVIAQIGPTFDGSTCWIDPTDNVYQKPGLYCGDDSMNGRDEYKLDFLPFHVIHNSAGTPTLTKEMCFAYMNALPTS